MRLDGPESSNFQDDTGRSFGGGGGGNLLGCLVPLVASRFGMIGVVVLLCRGGDMGQRLDAATKRPIGEPFVVFTPRNERMFLLSRPMFGPAVRPGGVIFEMTEGKANVWIGE